MVPQIGMVGGKWTTYRAFSEATADMALADLGLPRKISTRDLPIGGGAGFSTESAAGLAQAHDLTSARAAHLADLHGTRAAEVAAFCASVDDRPLPGSEMTEAEVLWAVRREMSLHLADVLQRRSPLAIRGLLTLPLVTATARVMATELGWSEARTTDEVAHFLGELETYHGVRLTPSEGAQP